MDTYCPVKSILMERVNLIRCGIVPSSYAAQQIALVFRFCEYGTVKPFLLVAYLMMA